MASTVLRSMVIRSTVVVDVEFKQVDMDADPTYLAKMKGSAIDIAKNEMRYNMGRGSTLSGQVVSVQFAPLSTMTKVARMYVNVDAVLPPSFELSNAEEVKDAGDTKERSKAGEVPDTEE